MFLQFVLTLRCDILYLIGVVKAILIAPLQNEISIWLMLSVPPNEMS